MGNLFAVAAGSRVYCAECAFRKFGEELATMPDDHTAVYDDDSWKHEIQGFCECGYFVDASEE